MANIKPAVILEIGEPDQKGKVLAPGVGVPLDFRADAQRVSGLVTPLATEPSWDLAGTEVVSPNYPALTLRGKVQKTNMSLSQWACSPPEQWAAPLVPDKPSVNYLWYHDSRANQTGTAVSTFLLPARPQFAFTWFDYAPHRDVSGDVGVEIILRYGESDELMLVLPLSSDTYKYPTLFRSGEIVDEFQSGIPGAELLDNSGPKAKGLVFRNLPGATVISFKGAHADWVTRVLGHGVNDWLEPGRVAVRAIRHAMQFHLQTLTFDTGGTAHSKWLEWEPYYTPAANTFVVPEDVSGYTAPTGTSVSAAVETQRVPSDQHRLKLTLSTSDPQQTPVVGWSSMYGTTSLGTALDDNFLADLTEAGDLYRVEWRIRDTYRGSVLKATVRNWDGQYEWKGNNWTKLQMGWDDGGGRDGLTYYDQFAGFLDKPKYWRRFRDDAGRALIKLRARDWAFRFRKKAAFMFPAFGGWPFGDACRYVLNRCGVPDSLIEIPTSMEDYVVPWDDVGLVSFAYDDDANPLRILDHLCNAVASSDASWEPYGIFVRFMPSGVVRIWPGTTYTDGAEELTINDSGTGANLITRFDGERGLDDFRNHVAVVGKKGQSVVRVMVRDADSQFARTDDKFLGDDWWEVITDLDMDAPELRAEGRLEERLRISNLVLWKCRGHPELMPNDFVKVGTVANCNVPSDTIFRITEKRSEARMDTLRWETTFLGELTE
ncbi:MAG: hypothetical protein PVH68_09885 [Armatimonadota bacterium]